VLCVAGLTAAHLAAGWPSAQAVALTPDLLARGKVWLLATSAFLVDSETLLGASLSLLALAVCVAYLRGSRLFLSAALAGHVGSTLIVYAGLGIIQLARVGGLQALVDQSDYGTSCVWTGALGAAAVQARQDRRRGIRIAVPLAAVLAVGALTGSSDGLALPEHLVAFVLGALVVVAARSRVEGRLGRGTPMRAIDPRNLGTPATGGSRIHVTAAGRLRESAGGLPFRLSEGRVRSTS
jgi:membrane associated rhomboid family serine protease